MKKDLKKLAEKYDSLSDFEKVDLEGKASGEVIGKWFSNRPEEMDYLIECSWFHSQELGVKIGKDGRLKLDQGVISEIPEDETEEYLKSASDFIADYFFLVAEYIENPDKADLEKRAKNSSQEWGNEEFLIGLLDRRRGGDLDLFE